MIIGAFIFFEQFQIGFIKYEIFIWNLIFQCGLKNTPGKVAGNEDQQRRIFLQGIQNKINHKVKLFSETCDFLFDESHGRPDKKVLKSYERQACCEYHIYL